MTMDSSQTAGSKQNTGDEPTTGKRVTDGDEATGGNQGIDGMKNAPAKKNTDVIATRSDWAESWKHIHRRDEISMTCEYFVYLDKELKLRWETTTEYDNKHTETPKYELSKCNAISNRCAVLEATPCDEFASSMKLHFKHLLGEAITCSLEHDYIGADGVLASAAEYLRVRSEETSRFWYLWICFMVALPLLVAGLVIWIERQTLEVILTPVGYWVVLAGIAGAAGALFSVVLRSAKLQFDSNAGKHLHYLEGFSRIMIGMLSGGVVALAMKTDIFLGVLKSTAHPNALTLLAAFAAGASERLAGSIISKIETSEVKLPSASGQAHNPTIPALPLTASGPQAPASKEK